MTVPVAVFASGGGSNFQSLLDHKSPTNPGRIELLICDRPLAGALERARQAGVSTEVIPVAGRSLDKVGEETLSVLRGREIQVILLAGYLRLIPPAVIAAFPGRILNIHPALLPAFGGKGMWGHHVHEAVLASGVCFSGPTIHFVDEEYDTGSILAQWPVPVLRTDTPDTLAARVLVLEHLLYPLAAEALCRAVSEGREVTRLSPPGGAVHIGSDLELDRLSAQIAGSLFGAQ